MNGLSTTSSTQVVEEALATDVAGRPMVRFAAKLKILKKKLVMWNRKISGNIQQGDKDAEMTVEHCEDMYDNNPTKANKVSLYNAQQKLNYHLEVEDAFWR